MLKFLSVSMISIAVLLVGRKNATIIKERAMFENEFILLLSHVRTVAASQTGDLAFAYKTFNGTLLEKSGLMKALRQTDDSEKAFKAFKDKLLTAPEETELLHDFFRKIGRCRTNTECCELCMKYTELLKHHAENKTAEEKNKAELIRKFSVLISAAVFVILI